MEGGAVKPGLRGQGYRLAHGAVVERYKELRRSGVPQSDIPAKDVPKAYCLSNTLGGDARQPLREGHPDDGCPETRFLRDGVWVKGTRGSSQMARGPTDPLVCSVIFRSSLLHLKITECWWFQSGIQQGATVPRRLAAYSGTTVQFV